MTTAAATLAIGLAGALQSARAQEAPRAPAAAALGAGTAKSDSKEKAAAAPDAAKTDSEKVSPDGAAAAAPDAAQKSGSSTTAAPATQVAPAAGDTTAQAPAAAPADPIVTAVRLKLIDAATVSKVNKDDIAAIVAFYAERSAPVWVDNSGFTAKAKAAMGEVRKADDWGLSASAFNLPSLPEGQASPEALGEAEAKLSLELLKYARQARGGRVNPQSLSRILDQVPPVKDPKVVLNELALADVPDHYLQGLHPQHEQFERLRQALLKARGPVEKQEEPPIDEALKVKLPRGNLIKPGAEHADVGLLRKRLKVPAEAGVGDTLFDPKLVDAVKTFQKAKGLDATGTLNSATRRALNAEGEPKKAAATPQSNVQRLLINMERWRWMPDSLGSLYVWDNIPEFYGRVIKDREVIFKEKIIVGLPDWATPVFSAKMQYIIFNPSWGVPDGIKTRELLPRLREAGGFFFFGGGGGSVLRAYGLTAYRGGQEIDPDSVNWSSVDIRSYSFVQPPGGKNPLGMVKFRFPNKHDVYMHDTVQRELFAQSYRALSHGCIRVENPRKLAAILLGADKGWSPEKVASAISGGGEHTLDKPIPVHITYFTAMVDEQGKVTSYADIYGHDSRLWAALTGQTLRLDPALETASGDDYGSPLGPAPAPAPGKKKQSNYSKYSGPATLQDAISGLLGN
jgi:murein L,D-transpeptidase YcbB/YkuD